MGFLNNNKGFVLGVMTALLVVTLPTPESLSIEAHRTAALFLLMGAYGGRLKPFL